MAAATPLQDGGAPVGETAGHQPRGPVRRAAERARLLLQLAATAAALGWAPGNFTKLAVMAAVWAIGFRRFSRSEFVLMLGIDAIFVLADIGALHNGAFRFATPDFTGLPVFEFFMWGFYTLHTIRFVGGRTPCFAPVTTPIVAVLFALVFATIHDPTLLLLAATAVVAAGFVRFHEPADFAYAGYMVAIGALIEHVGVATGQWFYPAAPPGAVPLWFVPMWGGVGLLTRRLFVPPLRGGCRPDSRDIARGGP